MNNLVVFYRMCGINSTNPPPLYGDNKFALNRLCLRSFRRAFTNMWPDVVFILDHCEDKYLKMIDEECVGFNKEVIRTNLGINETCLLQYELYKKYDHKKAFFLECDYTWTDNKDQFTSFLWAIDKFGLVSPYDHPNFYFERSIHSNETQIELVGPLFPYHYRTVERNTMTFAIRKDVFEKNYEILKKHGYIDNEVWKEMRENGNPLWVSVPTLATHMVRDCIAPGLSKDHWSRIWKTLM